MRYWITFLLCTSCAFSDCLFRVFNYSLYPVKVKVGFYHGESSILDINYSGVRSVSVADDKMCTASGEDGNGVVYANLVGGKSSGGWRYLPQSNMIRAMGKSVGSGDFVIGTNENGNNISLFNNYKPESGVFEVRIMPSQFRDSKTGLFN